MITLMLDEVSFFFTDFHVVQELQTAMRGGPREGCGVAVEGFNFVHTRVEEFLLREQQVRYSRDILF